MKTLLGFGTKVDFRELMMQGAQIIDVRTPEEFRSGHLKGSINIPVNVIQSQSSKIRKDKPVIVCCRSGMRSAAAAGILKNCEFEEIYDGGGWMDLQPKVEVTNKS